jgi:hypothetical protein
MEFSFSFIEVAAALGKAEAAYIAMGEARVFMDPQGISVSCMYRKE